MEPNVWTQLFVQVVNFLFNRSASSSNPESQNSGGVLPSAPESGAATTSISTNATILAVVRDPKMTTTDALFGRVSIDGNEVCYSMERTAVCIPVGTYHGYKRFSPHLNRTVVGIDVPGRTDIEGHNANYPGQLLGCIAFGSTVDNDSLDSSVVALEKVLSLLPQAFTVVVSSL